MESTGENMKIHVSETTKKYVEEFSGYIFEQRGVHEVKVRFAVFASEDQDKTHR